MGLLDSEPLQLLLLFHLVVLFQGSNVLLFDLHFVQPHFQLDCLLSDLMLFLLNVGPHLPQTSLLPLRLLLVPSHLVLPALDLFHHVLDIRPLPLVLSLRLLVLIPALFKLLPLLVHVTLEVLKVLLPVVLDLGVLFKLLLPSLHCHVPPPHYFLPGLEVRLKLISLSHPLRHLHDLFRHILALHGQSLGPLLHLCRLHLQGMGPLLELGLLRDQLRPVVVDVHGKIVQARVLEVLEIGGVVEVAHGERHGHNLRQNRVLHREGLCACLEGLNGLSLHLPPRELKLELSLLKGLLNGLEGFSRSDQGVCLLRGLKDNLFSVSLVPFHLFHLCLPGLLHLLLVLFPGGRCFESGLCLGKLGLSGLGLLIRGFL